MMTADTSTLHQLRASAMHTIELIDAILEGNSPVPAGSHHNPWKIAGICEFVSDHALDRFRERTGSKKSDDHILKQISGMLSVAEEMELKPKFRLVEMLAHGGHARYFRAKQDGLMFVVENDCVVTVHTGTANRWVRKGAI